MSDDTPEPPEPLTMRRALAAAALPGTFMVPATTGAHIPAMKNCGDGISAGTNRSCELARSPYRDLCENAYAGLYLTQDAAGGYSDVTLSSVIQPMRGVGQPSCFSCNAILEDRAFEAKEAA